MRFPRLVYVVILTRIINYLFKNCMNKISSFIFVKILCSLTDKEVYALRLFKGTVSWYRNGQSRVISLFKGTANLMEKKQTERVELF